MPGEEHTNQFIKKSTFQNSPYVSSRVHMCLMCVNTLPVLVPRRAIPYTYNIIQYKTYKQSQQKIIQKDVKITIDTILKIFHFPNFCQKNKEFSTK